MHLRGREEESARELSSKHECQAVAVKDDDDEKSEMDINDNPLDPVPVSVVKLDGMNGDSPNLAKGAEIQMRQMYQLRPSKG